MRRVNDPFLTGNGGVLMTKTNKPKLPGGPVIGMSTLQNLISRLFWKAILLSTASIMIHIKIVVVTRSIVIVEIIVRGSVYKYTESNLPTSTSMYLLFT